MPDAVYHRDGELYAPTAWAGSPWSRELQHGGPVCGLVARAAEAAAGETGLAVARLTVDLCRPTPLAPLAVVWRYVRRGRRLALLEVALRAGEEEVTRGSALLLGARGQDGAGARGSDEPPPPGPGGLEATPLVPREYLAQAPPGFHRSIDVRLCEDELGPAAWLTTPLALVQGEVTTPLVRAAMLSDLTFAIGSRLLLARRPSPPDLRRAMINADLTLYFERPPEGEWLAFRHAALGERRGVGVAEVAQLDSRGRYARSLQALVANAWGA